MQLRGILGNLTQLNATICNLVKVNAIYGCWVLNRIKSPTTRRQDVCCTGADFVHPLPTPPRIRLRLNGSLALRGIPSLPRLKSRMETA